VGVARYVTKQSFVNSNYKLVNVQWYVTQAAFKGFTEEGINPGFVTMTFSRLSIDDAIL